MIGKGILCFSLAGIMTMTADASQTRSEVVSARTQTAAVSSGARSARGDQIRDIELRQLKGMICYLGGKPDHAPILLKAGKKFEIDPLFLAAVTYVESSFRHRARSGKGACGLMQLRPIITKAFGVTDPWDPHQNIMGGAAYLRSCFQRYSKHSNSTFLALAAYNVGPGPVKKLNDSQAAKRFVKKVLSVYNRFTDEPIRLSSR